MVEEPTRASRRPGGQRQSRQRRICSALAEPPGGSRASARGDPPEGKPRGCTAEAGPWRARWTAARALSGRGSRDLARAEGGRGSTRAGGPRAASTRGNRPSTRGNPPSTGGNHGQGGREGPGARVGWECPKEGPVGQGMRVGRSQSGAGLCASLPSQPPDLSGWISLLPIDSGPSTQPRPRMPERGDGCDLRTQIIHPGSHYWRLGLGLLALGRPQPTLSGVGSSNNQPHCDCNAGV